MVSHRYPNLQPAIPSSRAKTSTTVRLLKPGIVMGTVVLLTIASATGMAVAVGVLRGRHAMGVMAAQGFVVVAAVFAISYVLLHFVAACHNEPVGIVRPPEKRLHAACFIVARLGLVGWIVSLIASSVVAARRDICRSGGRDCRGQLVEVVMSGLAFIATGTILTALEACPCPFQSPEVFHVARKISVRVSSFEEDFLARSISASTLNQESEYEPKDQEPSLKQSIKRKPLPTSPSMGSEISEISEISSAQRPITPLLPMAQKTRARGWGEDWTHLVDDTGSKGLTHSDSAVSGLSRSSSGYLSSGSSELSVSNRGQQPRVVTPSSSISELTKRSPLSTMRSAEYPDIAIRPSLRYCPPNISAPHEWNAARTASLSQLLPTAGTHSLQRRSLSMGGQKSLVIRRPSHTLPPLAHQRRNSVSTKRRSCDIKVPGAYIDFRLSFEVEQSLEEHAKKIESMSVARSESDGGLKPLLPPEQKYLEKVEVPTPVDSKLRFREKRPTVPPLQTKTENPIARPHTAKPPSTPLGKENLSARDRRFKRLSLGDMIVDFDRVFDVT